MLDLARLVVGDELLCVLEATRAREQGAGRSESQRSGHGRQQGASGISYLGSEMSIDCLTLPQYVFRS